MRKEHRTILIQILLFIVTFITTTIAGAEWVHSQHILVVIDEKIAINQQYSWQSFFSGLEFSIPFLLILTVHEFGHYFTAMYHKVRATLPYYIPFPSVLFPSIGTLGAVIRIKDRVRSNLQHFDIGLAGPLAGFILSLFIIGYGFATLPPAEHIFTIHPEYKEFGLNYADHVYTDEYMAKYMKEHNLKEEQKPLDFQVGSTLLFEIFGSFVSDKQRIPNPHEMMHYPFLFAGFMALFFTSMNLLPIGQLDGGHVTYGLFGGKRHKTIATVFFVVLFFYAGLGMLSPRDPQKDLFWQIPLAIGFYYLCFRAISKDPKDQIMYALLMFAVQFVLAWIMPQLKGYSGWFLFGFLVSRIGIQHPPAEIEIPLDRNRIILGWVTLLIFILCFSPKPF